MTAAEEFLASAAAAAKAGQPTGVTVRELLSYWGAKDRGTKVVARIQEAMGEYGLHTHPSIMKVALDATVELQAADGVEPEPDGTAQHPDEDPEDPVGLTVGNLDSAFGGVVSVTPQSSYETAQTQMMLNDFSQLAVMNGPHSLIGAVTWESMARAKVRDASAPFAAAIDRDVTAVRFDTELFSALPTIVHTGFVFVRDTKSAISGIVTTANLSEQYAGLAEPFLLLGEIDRLLRRALRRVFQLEDVLLLLDGGRQIGSFDELSMGDYQRILENPRLWDQLGWALDRSVFVQRLDEVRSIRNDVMHFNPDPATQERIDEVRNLVRVLREFAT